MPPSLPMYTPAGSPDAWHRTVAPGGYESWQVTFSDPASDTHLFVSLMTGCPYHPTYLDQYARYLGKPTTTRPPLPPAWPCAHLVLFRNDEPYVESLTSFPPELFAASPTALDTTVGLNRLYRTADALHLAFRGRPLTRTRFGARHPNGLLQLDLSLFAIARPSPPSRLFPESPGEGEHHWSVVASPCTATGNLQLRLGNGPTAKTETLALTGRASIDHAIGTRPLSTSFSAWLTGTAFFPRAAIPVRVACAKTRPSEALVAIHDADNQFQPFPPTSTRTTWTRTKRPHPTHVDAPPFLRLDAPRLLRSTGPLTHLIYRATTPDHQTGHAICQLLHPDQIPGRFARMFLSPKLARS